MSLYRHGDVIIGQVDVLPENAQPRGDVVLAYGENTGHSHRVADPSTATLFEAEGLLYIKVIKAPAQVIHEEHATIDLPEGVYRVWQQREYTPTAIRRIYD